MRRDGCSLPLIRAKCCCNALSKWRQKKVTPDKSQLWYPLYSTDLSQIKEQRVVLAGVESPTVDWTVAKDAAQHISKRCVKPARSWLKDFVSPNTKGHVWTTWPQALPVYHADRPILWAVSKLIWINLKAHLFLSFDLPYLLSQHFSTFSTRRFIYISEDMAMWVNVVLPGDTWRDNII